jgi:Lon protease-like protein
VEEEENTIDQKNLLELIDKTKKFFKMFQLSTDWQVVEKVKPDQLINSLAMICPFTTGEKQRLLETTTLEERNNILNQIINFYILSNQSNSQKNIH